MVDKSEKPLVTITGVSGYLGSHVALLFLKDGGFRVRGTVRDPANASKVDPLKKAFGDLFENLELVKAELDDRDAIIKACEGATFVIHTASPFPMLMPKNAHEVIEPAVNGTKNIMEACHVHKVKRVVITSSLMSVQNMKPENMPKDYVFDESHWSETDGNHLNHYAKSKTIAERVAWEQQAKLPLDQQTEIVTICPGMILGPAFVGKGFTSGQIIDETINGKYPGLPKFSTPIVDVRDCAKAHLEGIKKEDAGNKRFLLVAKSIWFVQLAEILSKEFKPQGYSFSTWELPKWMASFASWFNDDLSTLMRFWGIPTKFTNQRSIDILGIDYYPVEKTVTEMAYSMFETGALVDKRKVKK